MSAPDAQELIRGGAQLVDVRDKNEWNAGHAPQAVHIPTSDLSGRLTRLKKDKTVVVVCRSGARARQATKILRQHGYEAFNLAGGMTAWQSSGGSVLDRKDRPGRIA